VAQATIHQEQAMNSLEHALIILLLLVGLLNSQVLRGYWWVILGAILALAIVSPVYPLPLPWNWLAALVLPLLFWQTARRLVQAAWTTQLGELALFSSLALALALVLNWLGGLQITGALLFGLVIASIAWRAAEGGKRSTYLGQIGALALAFLLAELRPEGQGVGSYIYSLAGGAFIGSLTGYFTSRAASRAAPGWQRNLLSIAQGYLAYGLALLLNLSPVAATIISIVVYIDFGFRRGLWEKGFVEPRPLANRAIFGALMAALAFFAWQTHVPITTLLLLDLFLALAVVAVFVFVGRWFNFPSFRKDRPVWRIFLGVVYLVPSALLLWPREALLQPEPLAVATLAAAVTILVTYIGLSPLMNLYSYLERDRVAPSEADELYSRLVVEDLLVTNFPTAAADTRMGELTRMLASNENACLPVVDEEDHLLGMITQADLFFKEQTAPQSSLAYITLFGEAVMENHLITTYIESAENRCAADVMTERLLWVEKGSRVGDTLQLMIRSSVHCIPVMTGDPLSGGRLMGLFTRSNLIRCLSDANQVKELRSRLVEREKRGD
jgi:CBS domain-containing protein